VVLAVPDEDTLISWADMLCYERSECADYVLFHEPDLGDGEHTALATVDDGERFASLPLAGYAMT
jgi:hypothetical protein